MLVLDIQREVEDDLPDDKRLRIVTQETLKWADGDARGREVSLRLVGRDEMRGLNARYRGRDYATNVLSFPAEIPDSVDTTLLGDVVICAPVVACEALAQHKPAAAHWDHMLVHGLLHLLGHDHESDADAEVMENLERQVLAALGWPDPYLAVAEGAPLAEMSE